MSREEAETPMTPVEEWSDKSRFVEAQNDAADFLQKVLNGGELHSDQAYLRTRVDAAIALLARDLPPGVAFLPEKK